MKNTFVKRALSIVLSIVMIVSCAVAAFATSASIDPIILVGGIENNPLLVNPEATDCEALFPPTDTNMAIICNELLTLLVASSASGDYQEILNFTYSQIYPIMDKIALNNDGTNKSANVGVKSFPYPLSYYKTDTALLDTAIGELGKGMVSRIGYNNIYVFTYDWRIDPVENADKLADFVDHVKQMSHKDQVSIVSKGFGSTIATTYLSTHSDTAFKDVSKFVTVESAFLGTSLIGDIYTGDVVVKDSSFSWPNNVGYGQVVTEKFPSAVIRFTNDFSNNPITASVWGLVNYILNREWEIQELCYDIVTVMGHVITPMYNQYLRQMLRNYLGLWAMVPLDYYDDAIDYMFMDQEYPNETLLKKIDDFKNIQANIEPVFKKAQAAGMDISIVSSWDIQLIPIGNDYQALTANSEEDINGIANELYGLSAQSDGIIDTYYSSFGGYCTALNDVGRAVLYGLTDRSGERDMSYLSDKLEQTCKNRNHNHLSENYDQLSLRPGDLGGIPNYIDASTCMLPENTYFIRNMRYDDYTADSDFVDFIVWLAVTDDTDVWSYAYYDQFQEINRYIEPHMLHVGRYYNKGLYLLGDVNLDGKVTTNDAKLLLRIVAQLEEMPDANSIQFRNGDVNNDGKLTTNDVKRILMVIAEQTSF